MTPKRSTLDWLMEAASLAALALIIGTVLVHWDQLPPQVPKHFGASGQPNGWGSRNTLLLLPAIAAGIYVLATAATYFTRLVNLPIEIDRDSPDVQRVLTSFAIAMKLSCLLVFLYITGATVRTALGRSAGLGGAFLPVSLIATFSPTGYYLLRLRRYEK